MSIRVMTAVWERSTQRGSALLVLLAIADYADDDGVAFPSVGKLAEKSRMSERSVQYVLTRAVKAGELEIRRGAGRSGANLYRVRVQGGGAKIAPGARLPEGGAKQRSKGVQPVAPEPSLTVIENRQGAGQAGASPVAAAFKAYQKGIRRRYGADYPASASASGILSRLVARLGAVPALRVVEAYLADDKDFYQKRMHSLEILAADGPSIWVKLQSKHAGAEGSKPTAAVAYFQYADGQVLEMAHYPVAEPLQVARRCASDYKGKLVRGNIKVIGVQIGSERSRFAVEELAA